MAAMETELIVGSLSPDFKLMANDGHEISLSDYRDKKLVVLFFVREYI
jgi:peroxiredoxin